MAAARRALLPARTAGASSHPHLNGLAGSQVADIQRRRILSAMFEVACERGAGNVTVAHVVERSGVSRRTFYELFEDREDCFLVAFERAVAYASERVLPAYRAAGTWRARIRAGLVAFLCFLDEEPAMGRVLVVESPTGGPRALARRKQVAGQIMGAIDQGRRDAKRAATPASLSPLVAESVLGGALSVIATRLLEERHEPMVRLACPLMSMIVLPYLGSAAARQELKRPVPDPEPSQDSSVAVLHNDPFKGAGMRLTYRTVRVLGAIAEQPQASNRTIGERAGIKDQGQISKLLGRLERIGLIANSGLGPGQGAPNAWALTPAGRQVASNMRAYAQNTPQHGGIAR